MDAEVREISANSIGRAPRSASSGGEVVIEGNSNGAVPSDVPLEMLEKALENACETLATLATNVMDFSYDSQHVLFSKVCVFLNLYNLSRWQSVM